MEDYHPSNYISEYSLSMAITELGLDRYPDEAEQLNVLFRWQQELDLPFTLRAGHSFQAPLVSDGVDEGEKEHEDGSLECFSKGRLHDISSSKDCVVLGRATLGKNGCVAVHTVIVDGHEYYAVERVSIFGKRGPRFADGIDEDANRLIKPFDCHIDDLFIYKEDLRIFQNKKPGTVQLWADPDSDYYAPEIVLAVEAHRAIRLEHAYGDLTTREERVARWLAEKKPGIKDPKDTLAGRISTVIGNGTMQARAKK